MSISVTTDVFCDGNGCSLWTHGVTNGSRTAAKHARREAKRAGWSITKRGDYCPACAAALSREAGHGG